MFSNQTPNYGLPQWENDDKPTWLADMNGAFANIDENLKRVEEMAEEGGVPQEIIDRIVALETSVTNIVAKIGKDVIDTIGTSITNALVNLKSAIDTATANITSIINEIGDTNISDVGNSITQAIRNLADTGVPQTIIDRITALETSVTNILTKIGTDVIDTIGTSITNAIVNLNTQLQNIKSNYYAVIDSIDIINSKIGNVDISQIGNSITQAIVNLKSAIDTATTNITNILTKIGDTNISDVGNSITQAIRNLADTGVPQTIIDRITALETSVTNILTTIGADAISGIGTSITNAIVNLNSRLTSLESNFQEFSQSISIISGQIEDLNFRLGEQITIVNNIITQIGNDVITGIGTSITNAIINLKNRIDNIMTLIGDADISSVGTSITQAILNLKTARTLYNHQIALRFNDGNRKCCINIVHKKDSALTVAELTTYLQNGFHALDETITGMLGGILISQGYYKTSSNQWYDVVGISYSDSSNNVVVLGRPLNATGANQVLILNEHEGIFSLQDIVSEI